MDKYPYEKKKLLADRIGEVRKKEHMKKIFAIIRKENPQITENNNGIFLFFHNYNTSTYVEIEQYLDSIKKDSNSSERLEYTPYATDEFSKQNNISPKLKYSNKEKILIKKHRYDKSTSEQNYRKFDLDMTTTDSECKSEKNSS